MAEKLIRYALRPQDKLFFLHLPKTGGTTLFALLRHLFEPEEVLSLDEKLEVPVHELHQHPEVLSPDLFAPYRLIRGHYDYTIYRYFQRPPLFLTLLRNPVERTLSFYGEHCKRYANPVDFHGFVCNTKPDFSVWMENPQTRWLAGHPLGDGVPDDVLLELARANLESMPWFGLQEQMNASLRLLAYTFGWPAFSTLPHLNATPDAYKPPEIAPKTLQVLRARTALDAELFRHACQLFVTRCEALEAEQDSTTTMRAWLRKLFHRPARNTLTVPHLSSVARYKAPDEVQFFHDLHIYSIVFPESDAGRVQPVEPSQTVTRTPPYTLHQDLRGYAEKFATFQTPNASVFSASDASVHFRDNSLGVVLSNGVRIGVLPSSAQPLTRHVAGTLVLLSTQWSDNYFHWMTRVVPSFHLLDKCNISVDQLVIRPLNRFQQETLEALGIAPSKLRLLEEGLSLNPDRMVIPVHQQSTLSLSPWAVAYLRRTLLPSEPPQSPTRRLYISRQKTSRRRVRNEADLLDVLTPMGFEVVHLETLSLRTQIELFASAEAVVSPHGAGLTNLAFCQPGTRVVELFAPHYVKPLYWTLSSLVGARYACLLGEPEAQNPAHTPERRADLTIDIDKFRKTLGLVGL